MIIARVNKLNMNAIVCPRISSRTLLLERGSLYEGSILFSQTEMDLLYRYRLGTFHPWLRDVWSKVKLWHAVDCTRIDESTCALRRNRSTSTYVCTRVATAAAKWLHSGLTSVSAQNTVEWNSFRVSVVLLCTGLTVWIHFH